MEDIIDEFFTEETRKPLLKINPRRKFVVITIVSVLMLNGIISLLQYIQFGNIQAYLNSSTYNVSLVSTIQNTANFSIFIAFLYLAAFITASVAVCVWIYRANQNLHLSKLSNIQHSSGWSVGWFFIPFANLIKPAQVMSEVEKGTVFIAGENNMSTWKSKATNSFVILWWVLYIVSGAFSNVSQRMYDDWNLEANNYSLISTLDLISLVLLTISGIILVKLVNEISQKQENVRSREDLN